MNREIDKLTYNTKTLDFIELLYYNGPKLCVNMDKKYILAWNKEFEEHERWFLIKSSSVLFDEYISGKTTLLEVMNNSEIEIIKRAYDDYYTLSTITKEQNLDDYNLPGEKSYLGFDFLSEYNYSKFVEKDTSPYTVKLVDATQHTYKAHDSNIWDNLEVISNHTRKESYAA